MQHKLHCSLRTKDGHLAVIHKKRNALLMFRYQYHVSIMSGCLYAGNRRAVIYGWSGVDIEKIKKEVRAWTVADILKQNPYLRPLLLLAATGASATP